MKPSTFSPTVVPLSPNLSRAKVNFHGLIPSSLKKLNKPTLLNSPSPIKHHPTITSPLREVLATPSLSKEDSFALMERMRLILRHLRARITCDRHFGQNETRVFDPTLISNHLLKEANTIALSESLTATLNSFPISTIAGVVKLAFQSQLNPFFNYACGSELIELFESSEPQAVVPLLKQFLKKLPEKQLVTVGQLMWVLHADDSTGLLAQTWASVLFMPCAEQQGGLPNDFKDIDPIRWSQTTVSLTQLMIKRSKELFPPLDEGGKLQLLLEEMIHAREEATKEQHCKVMFSFVAETPLELTVKRGDILQVLEKGTDCWWKCQNHHNGQTGLVPETYVELLHEETDKSVIEVSKQKLVHLKALKEKQSEMLDPALETLPSMFFGPPPLPPLPNLKEEDQQRESRAEAYKEKGNAKLIQKEYRWAIECYSQALELSSSGKNSHLFYSNRAAAYIHLQEYESACADCVHAIRLEPTFAKAFARLAQAQLGLGKLKEAKESACEAYRLDSKNDVVKSTYEKVNLGS